MDSDGHNMRTLEGIRSGFPSDGYAWSPDGRKIVSSVAWYFSLYDVETGIEERVQVPDAGFIGNFAWVTQMDKNSLLNSGNLAVSQKRLTFVSST